MKCHYCKAEAMHTWKKKAHMCKFHFDELFREQLAWYGKQITSGERVLFNQIAHLIRPAGRKRGIRRTA